MIDEKSFFLLHHEGDGDSSAVQRELGEGEGEASPAPISLMISFSSKKDFVPDPQSTIIHKSWV